MPKCDPIDRLVRWTTADSGARGFNIRYRELRTRGLTWSRGWAVQLTTTRRHKQSSKWHWHVGGDLDGAVDKALGAK
jgi:hypothetical protein